MGDRRTPNAPLRPGEVPAARDARGDGALRVSDGAAARCLSSGGPERRDLRFGTTPLHWCCHGSVNRGNQRGEYPEIARLMIAAGARLDQEMLDWPGTEEVLATIDEALRERLPPAAPPR